MSIRGMLGREVVEHEDETKEVITLLTGLAPG